ncbi:hypothetical protein L1049_010190 [Liquidambar formosana]|uniref:Cytochrome P450 n=1 Tax=Liquidambar formosana TaxID=63359 RepID=A0AAP0N9D1_LIQFO
MDGYASFLLSVLPFTFLALILGVLYFIWWKPKMIERYLNKQGIHGLPYRLLYGNLKEMSKVAKEATSKPNKFSHGIIQRADPLIQKTMLKLGKLFFVWFGPVPQLVVMEPELIKEILNNKSGDFGKMQVNSFTKLFTNGLANIDGEIWAKHRKIINPSFHMEKLKRMLPAFSICCDEMIEKWEKLVGLEGSCELDVHNEFQILTGDVISRAAFGSNFEEGRRIFHLQKEQGDLFVKSFYMMVFPWLSGDKAWEEG